MFRFQPNSYLKTSTSEAYQPVRLTCTILNMPGLLNKFEQIYCISFNEKENYWECRREHEAGHIQLLNEMHTAKIKLKSIVLARLTVEDKKLSIRFDSLERCYLLLPLFYKWFNPNIAIIQHADFINSYLTRDTDVININEPFNEQELNANLHERQHKVQNILTKCHSMPTDKAVKLIATEALRLHKDKFLLQERYLLELSGKDFAAHALQMMAFSTSMMLRLKIAQKRWQGDNTYTFANALNEIKQLIN